MELEILCIYSILAYILTSYLIPKVAPVFISKGRFGKDLLKAHQPITPESLGVVIGLVFFIFTFMYIPIPFLKCESHGQDVCMIHGLTWPFPHSNFAQYIGGQLAILSMLFLGFADDVLDIKWRFKIWAPVFASIPLLMVYFVTYGRTDILVPLPLRFLFPQKIVALGPLYYVYLTFLCIFSTNSINILAGVNGVEGGQSLIIAISIVINDLIQLYIFGAKSEAHMNSLYFLLPFITTTAAYLKFNWYPAKIFGGDSYCYFAGMVFATVGILGNFSKTVLLFMIPQIFNFIFSCPQLFGLVPCPRHRMPLFEPKSNLIYASTFEMDQNTSKLGQFIVRVFEYVGLTHVKRSKSTKIAKVTNFTLINLILVKLGPLTEQNTAISVMITQIFCSILAFIVRYGLVHVVYNIES